MANATPQRAGPTITTITSREANRNFADFLSRALYRGERFLITRSGRPIAMIVPPDEQAAPENGKR